MALGAERDAVRHSSDGGRESLSARHQSDARSMAHSQAAGVPSRTSDSAGGAGLPSSQSRDADHGRAPHSHRRARADAALDQPDERVHVDRGRDHDAVWRHRVSGRLLEDRQARPSRAATALQAGSAVPDCDGRGHRPALAPASQPVQHAPQLSVLQGISSGPWLVVRPVHDVRTDRMVERRQFDRRSRRPRDRYMCDCGGCVYGAHLRRRDIECSPSTCCSSTSRLSRS